MVYVVNTSVSYGVAVAFYKLVNA